VHFDHHYSDRYTVLEIGGTNQWGLLYGISRVMSEHGCDIELVLISTEGDRAIDVFHLTRNGKKLSPGMEEELRSGLEQLPGLQSDAH
jgi:UTP:GlnB (protein PII) uridylyltransferase